MGQRGLNPLPDPLLFSQSEGAAAGAQFLAQIRNMEQLLDFDVVNGHSRLWLDAQHRIYRGGEDIRLLSCHKQNREQLMRKMTNFSLLIYQYVPSCQVVEY